VASSPSSSWASRPKSNWTYSDLFEEPGPPDRAFHGGFGLMTRDGVRKPTPYLFWQGRKKSSLQRHQLGARPQHQCRSGGCIHPDTRSGNRVESKRMSPRL
jgi:hypothetical protein